MITPEELNDKIEKSLEYQEECQLNDIMGRLNGRVTRFGLQDPGEEDKPTLVYDKFIKIDFLLFPNVIDKLKKLGYIVERIDNTVDYAYIKLPVNIVEEALNLIQENEYFQKVIWALFNEEENPTEEELEEEIKKPTKEELKEEIKKHVTKVLSIKSPEYEYKISWK